MAQSKTELLSALKKNFIRLQQIQNTNKGILKYLPKDFIKTISEGTTYLKNIGNEADDPCDMLDIVYPSSNVTKKGEKGYAELFDSLVRAIYSSGSGASLYNKVKGKNIYFIKAVSKDCFYNTNLMNLKPCRFNELKDYSFICLTSSDNFSVMELYSIDGALVEKIIPKEQLFDDRWEENEKDIKQEKWTVTDIDFYVKHVCIQDESGTELATENYKNPVIEDGIYKDFYLKTFNVTLKDSRPAYTYHDRRNGVSKRKTTFHIVGSQKEEISKEVVLEGMTKEVVIEMQHAYSINKITIDTNLDFDKWYLNGKSMIDDPNISKGKGVLTFGAGLAKGRYTIYVADANGNRSKDYAVEKDTKNGHVEVTFDLSKLSSMNWDKSNIVQQIQLEEERIKTYLELTILKDMATLLNKLNKSVSANVMKEIKMLTDDCKNMVDVAKDLLGEAIPFVKGICALINIVGSKVQRAQEYIKARQTYENITKAIGEIEQATEELSNFNSSIGDEEKNKLVWDYYEKLTGGHATTGMIISDIKDNFRKIH